MLGLVLFGCWRQLFVLVGLWNYFTLVDTLGLSRFGVWMYSRWLLLADLECSYPVNPGSLKKSYYIFSFNFRISLSLIDFSSFRLVKVFCLVDCFRLTWVLLCFMWNDLYLKLSSVYLPNDIGRTVSDIAGLLLLLLALLRIPLFLDSSMNSQGIYC